MYHIDLNGFNKWYQTKNTVLVHEKKNSFIINQHLEAIIKFINYLNSRLDNRKKLLLIVI